MTEGVKTLAYLGVALVIGLTAYFTRPTDVEFRTADDIQKLRGTPLFPDFKDPTEASGLEIVKAEESLGQVERFEVARDAKGMWTIPSHSGYPADAENQMRDVSVLFIDLPIIDVVSMASEDHSLFGVVEPTADSAETAEGVGTLVRITDNKNQKLVDLIIGKPVKDAEGQRFVRKPGQDVVYVAAVDTSKLSTKFEDWIEEDLLKLNAFDVTQLHVEDYSVVGSIEQNAAGQRFLRPNQSKKLIADLNWNSEKGEWSLASLTTFNGERPETLTELPEGEKLDTARLTQLKDSLDDLKIIDVRRKPAGLGKDLRADEDFMQNMESLQSLVEMGFYPMSQGSAAGYELRAANGELHVGMKNGVEYILRFGNTAGAQKDDAEKLNRYLFVTARFDESKIPMPVRPPELDAAPANSATPDSEAADSAAPAEGEDSAADEAAPAEDGAARSQSEDLSFVSTDAQEPEQEQGADEGADESADQPAADDVDETEAAAEAESQDAASETESEGSESAAPAASQDEEAASERARLEKEYQRQLDEREKKIKEGRQRVKELNDRFADWYYIISEDVYKKIHLTREDLLKSSEETGENAFRELEQGGFDVPEASEAADVPDAPEAPEASETADAPEAPEVPETSEASETSEAPEAAETFESPAP